MTIVSTAQQGRVANAGSGGSGGGSNTSRQWPGTRTTLEVQVQVHNTLEAVGGGECAPTLARAKAALSWVRTPKYIPGIGMVGDLASTLSTGPLYAGSFSSQKGYDPTIIPCLIGQELALSWSTQVDPPASTFGKWVLSSELVRKGRPSLNLKAHLPLFASRTYGLGTESTVNCNVARYKTHFVWMRA